MKRLVNRYEKLTHDALKPVLDRFYLSIYPKVRPYAIPEECRLKWDVGPPLPTLLQSDSRTLLLFYLASDVESVGVVDFGYCFATTLGGPNDETFEGHPLYGSGFMP